MHSMEIISTSVFDNLFQAYNNSAKCIITNNSSFVFAHAQHMQVGKCMRLFTEKAYMRSFKRNMLRIDLWY